MTLAEERPSDEVAPGYAFDAMARRMESMTAKPLASYSPRFITAERLGRWVVIRVGLRAKPEITFRLSLAWAQALYAELSRVLG